MEMLIMQAKNRSYVRWILLQALLQSLFFSTTCVANSWNDMLDRSTERLQQQGIDTSLPALQTLVVDASIDYDIRDSAASSIGQSKSQIARTFLLKLLKTNEEELQILALRGLAQLRDATTTRLIGHVLRRGDSEELINSAAYTLRAIGGSEAYEEYLSIGLDPALATNVRVIAISYLQSFRQHVPDKRFKKVLDTPDHKLHYTTAIYLSYHAAEELVPHLIQSALDDRLETHEWIQVVNRLQQITNNHLFITSRADLHRNPTYRKSLNAKIKTWGNENDLQKP